jgi:dihydropteroate synthase
MSRSASFAPALTPWRRTLLQEEARRLGLAAPEAAEALALLAGATREPGLHPPRALPWGPTTLALGTRTLIMGVINMTDDSFSGDGLGRDREAALARAEALVAAGADILDVGGESTRPGAPSVSAAEERARVEPAVARLASRLAVPISVDTRKAAVAEAALAAGAVAVNDVSGLRDDPALAPLVARTGAGLVLGHWPRAGEPPAEAPGPVGAVLAGLRASIARARAAGVAPAQLAVDPGLGFGKPPHESLALLRGLAALHGLGLPLVVGPSRKGFIGHVLGPAEQFGWEGTAAAVALAIAQGAAIVRVHDVARLVRVVRMADAIVRVAG